ncbi:hypothetical protein BGZ88_009834 [Linnemannia elongata]|nr:hypothetical protein BGZ88_009834 [Linnemannia elongata]
MLYNIPLQDNIVQGFRGVHKSYKPSTLTHIDPDDIIHINCYTHPETHINFILWDEIKQVFEEALVVKCGSNLHPYIKSADFRPKRPAHQAFCISTILSKCPCPTNLPQPFRVPRAHKTEKDVVAPKKSKYKSPLQNSRLLLLLQNSLSRHPTLEDLTERLKRRPKGPQDHAASVMAAKDLNEQMFQPLSRFLF